VVPFSLDYLYFGSNLDLFFLNIDQTTHTYFMIVQSHGITLSLFHPLTSMYMLSLSLSLGSFSLFLHVNLFHQPNLLLSFILLFFIFFYNSHSIPLVPLPFNLLIIGLKIRNFNIVGLHRSFLHGLRETSNNGSYVSNGCSCFNTFFLFLF